MNAIEVKGLAKTYRKGLARKRVEALRGIDLEVHEGEAFGFLGPNGAGKTTAIRILMGLINRGAGTAKIFGHELPSREARKRLGFLPEAPYFHDYLSVEELLDFTGRLFGQNKKHRAKRADELIDLVGLDHARKGPIKGYSKGMMQRAGIAQALMNDPDLVVFDEPMSGLDPIGRKDVRDIIHDLKESGKTIFFSSHILADVESVADRVAILVKGKIHDVGLIRDIVSRESGTEVRVDAKGASESELAKLKELSESHRELKGELTFVLKASTEVNDFVSQCLATSVRLISVVPVHETLEDVFVRAAKSGDN